MSPTEPWRCGFTANPGGKAQPDIRRTGILHPPIAARGTSSGRRRDHAADAQARRIRRDSNRLRPVVAEMRHKQRQTLPATRCARVDYFEHKADAIPRSCRRIVGAENSKAARETRGASSRARHEPQRNRSRPRGRGAPRCERLDNGRNAGVIKSSGKRRSRGRKAIALGATGCHRHRRATPVRGPHGEACLALRRSGVRQLQPVRAPCECTNSAMRRSSGMCSSFQMPDRRRDAASGVTAAA